MGQTITTSTPLANAMQEAERENVIMRKGLLFDVLLVAAKETAAGRCPLENLGVVIDHCELTLREQAEEHARRFPLSRGKPL